MHRTMSKNIILCILSLIIKRYLKQNLPGAPYASAFGLRSPLVFFSTSRLAIII